jgi:glutathione S-transferase
MLPAQATLLIDAASASTVWPPLWSQKETAHIEVKGEGDQEAALGPFRKQLNELEGLIRHSGGPYIYGVHMSAADIAMGPRLQCAMLGVRHFNGYKLEMPPYNALHRYISTLTRNQGELCPTRLVLRRTVAHVAGCPM